MPNDNSIGGELNQLRKILREVKEIKELLKQGIPMEMLDGSE